MRRSRLKLDFVRIIRWGIVLWSQAALLSIIILRVCSLWNRLFEPYVCWILEKAFFVFVFPAGFFLTLNTIALAVDGRRFAKWPWWRVLFTLFAMGIPVYAIYYYWKSEQQLLRLRCTT